MSVNFNPNVAFGKNLTFQKTRERNSDTYLESTAKGAVGGGILGAGSAVILKTAAAMDVTPDRVNLSNIKAKAEGLIGTRSVKQFTIAGALIGAVALVINRAFNGENQKRSFENLKPIS